MKRRRNEIVQLWSNKKYTKHVLELSRKWFVPDAMLLVSRSLHHEGFAEQCRVKWGYH